MKIAIGSDHRGYESKEHIKSLLGQLGHEVVDFGTNDNNPADYPDIAYLAANAISAGEVERAILICGSGIGMSISANKVKGIRAALCHDELSAQMSRQHNDCNVLCLSGDMTGDVLVRRMVEAWLQTEFQGGRHKRRVDKISAIEECKNPNTVK